LYNYTKKKKEKIKEEILLRETKRETKSPRPLCRKQEFYYARGLRGDNFSRP
jgi:hypothetical protein